MVFGPDITVLPGDTADGHIRRHLVHDPDQPRPDDLAPGVEQRDQPAALLRLGRSAGDFIPGSVVAEAPESNSASVVQTQSADAPFTYEPSVRRAGNARVSPAPDHDRIRTRRPLHDGHPLRSTPSISEEKVSVALRGRRSSPSSVAAV